MRRPAPLFLAAVALAAPCAAVQEVEAPPEVVEEEAEGEVVGYEYLEPDAVREGLEEVLSRPEFARLRAEPEKEDEDEDPGESGLPEWLDRFVDWLGSLFGRRGRGEASPSAFGLGSAGLVLLAMPAAILLAVLFFVGKAVLRTARERKVDEREAAKPVFGPGSAPGEVAPAHYWRHAQELSERGDYRGAIREILLAAMSTLERRGLIRFRKGLTNRDYLWAARGASRDSLAAIVRHFEHVYFGRREATAESYAECRRELEKSFPLEAAT